MSVIFSRAPLRISLGGGGTDLPSYYREHGGFFVSGAIDKYVYMLTHTVFQRRYRMKYSEMEEVDEIGADPPPDPARDAAAPLARQPARDRLGRRRAGRDRDGILGRLHRLPAEGPRARAAHLDHPRRARRGGMRDRDRRAAASRSASRIPTSPRTAASAPTRSTPDGTVEVEPLELGPSVLRRLRDQLLLFYTGEARSASTVLADQDERSKAGDEEMLENLHRTKELGRRSYELLKAGDLEAYAELMHEHWENKRRRSPGMANEHIDRALHARPSQRRDRRQARRRRRRRLPARVRAAARGHATGDGGGGRGRARLRLRVRRRLRERVRVSATHASRSSAAA